jgi:hypothetical protein
MCLRWAELISPTKIHQTHEDVEDRACPDECTGELCSFVCFVDLDDVNHGPASSRRNPVSSITVTPCFRA